MRLSDASQRGKFSHAAAARAASQQREVLMAPPKTPTPTSTVPWVEGLTIGQVLARSAERFPANDALAFPALGLKMSYAEFHRATYEAAK